MAVRLVDSVLPIMYGVKVECIKNFCVKISLLQSTIDLLLGGPTLITSLLRFQFCVHVSYAYDKLDLCTASLELVVANAETYHVVSGPQILW